MTRIATPLVFTAAGICIVLFINKIIFSLGFIFFAVMCAAVGVIGFNCSRQIWRKRGLNTISWAVGLLLGVVLLHTIEYENKYFVSGTELSQIASYEGYLTADSQVIGESLRLCNVQLISVTAKGESLVAQAHGSIDLYLKNGEDLYAGLIITVQRGLKRERKDFMQRIISWADAEDIEKHDYISWFYRLRASVFLWFEARIKLMGNQSASLFKALFLGDRSGLDRELKTSFYNTGSVHLLALSGLHVGIVFAFMGLLLFPISAKTIKIIIGSVFVFAYVCLIGPKPALLRASLMLIIGGAAVLLDRDLNLFNILCFSLIFAVCLDPASIYTLSFALSYCAVFGILVFGSKLNSILIPYLPSFFRIPLSLSIGAQLATLPLVLINFNQVYPLGFLVALLLIPLVTGFVWAGIIFIILTMIPFLPLYKIVSALMDAMYETIRTISGFFSYIPILKLSWQDWYWLPFLALLSLFFIPLRGRKSREL
ncbi:MAG: ComEC/Rec2 family competence protein [Spirochaetales bacterium]|nr:ComEC/Rec2 family competence protein [Spirochaetales bacterium]